MPRTLAEKIWDKHIIMDDGQPLIYIDLQLLHEVTSPQAFEGLRLAGRVVRRPELCVATMDHNVPTTNRSLPIVDELSRKQMDLLEANCKEFGIPIYNMFSREQGIVHMIGPELGVTQPGMTIVCGDSHTATHGAFGALAFGIGTSEIEHVLATQTLKQTKPKMMAIEVVGDMPPGVSAKDLVLSIIGTIGVDGGIGHIIEYRGNAIRGMSMEERMTICNMTIEGGARAGLIAPDEVTFEYIKGRHRAPKGDEWDRAVAAWKELYTDEGAVFDKVVTIDATQLQPTVTWGTTPSMSINIDEHIPTPGETKEPEQTARALEYMGLQGGEKLTDVYLDRIFIGSCTNGRISDLRIAAGIIKGNKIAPNIVHAMVVPGSHRVKEQAEAEGLHTIFTDAGFEWREPGCSMCLGMNPDILDPHQRCASTSNRNFEGRQGKDGRTHLVSPAMAAAAAIAGHFVDARTVPVSSL